MCVGVGVSISVIDKYNVPAPSHLRNGHRADGGTDFVELSAVLGVAPAEKMFRTARWRGDKSKIKAVFKLQFHATQVLSVCCSLDRLPGFSMKNFLQVREFLDLGLIWIPVGMPTPQMHQKRRN